MILAVLAPGAAVSGGTAQPQTAAAQPKPTPAPAPALLDKMLGNWVLRGTIEGKLTTHDVDVSWVLNHGYLRIHEIARDKTAAGAPEYEAIVLMSWDAKAGEVLCLWLDTTSNAGLSLMPTGLGHAKPTADSIPFAFFAGTPQVFRTTMTYSASANSWQWNMDGDENGKVTPFARLVLTRK
jgi:hypothetical protein